MSEPSFVQSTRAAYDTIAADYAERFRVELAKKPLDRALYTAFAELVLAAGSGPVADVGSGPGHLTAHLNTLGLNAFGIDLSPGMVAAARSAYPDLRFEEGSMLALDLPDGSLGGLVASYSIIHIPLEELPTVFAEFHRVLAPGGYLLTAFQVGDAHGHRSEAFGQAISLDYYLRQPQVVADLLSKAGLAMRAQLVREADVDGENAPRAYLLYSAAATRSNADK